MNEAEDESISEEEIEEIKEAFEDVKNGRVKSIEIVAKELGINI